MHNGLVITLSKVNGRCNPLDRRAAREALWNAREKGEMLTGLLYMDDQPQDLHKTLNTSERPLNALTKKELCPGADMLSEINAELR
jgi:2-oxoglutarate/2-oxoacid ferredoxin oxidoreductase subunit beta